MIASGKLTFDERVVLHRVDRGMFAKEMMKGCMHENRARFGHPSDPSVNPLSFAGFVIHGGDPSTKLEGERERESESDRQRARERERDRGRESELGDIITAGELSFQDS